MIKRLTAVAAVALALTGCVNDNNLSGDVYSASEAKQVQSVSYGTLISVRPVKIRQAVTVMLLAQSVVQCWVASSVILSVVVPDAAWRQPVVQYWAAWPVRAYRAA